MSIRGSTMRAIVCEAYDGTGALALRDMTPAPLAAGEARVDVHACGINFADTLIVEGRYQTKPALPFVPGFEIAGTVVETAPGVTSVSVGDRVMGILAWGGFADEVAMPAANLFRIPASMDFTTAAGFAIAYGTSYGALTWRAKLRDGETLLVHGAGSGTGLTAVEVGRALGATVIAVASSEDKRAAARRSGAHHVIEAGRDDFREQVKALTGGKGVNVVYDPVGGAAFDASLRVVAPEARIVVIGFASGEIPRTTGRVGRTGCARRSPRCSAGSKPASSHRTCRALWTCRRRRTQSSCCASARWPERWCLAPGGADGRSLPFQTTESFK
jgi:NADPH2:quinone reductase